MDDLFDSVKSRAETMLAELTGAGGLRSTIDSIRKKMAVADQRRAMARARDELKRLDAQLGDTITAVGLQAVSLHERGQLESPILAPLCQHVVTVRTALSEQKEELARLEAMIEARRRESEPTCPSCDRPVAPDGTFCAYCGTPLQTEPQASGPQNSEGSRPAQPTPERPAPSHTRERPPDPQPRVAHPPQVQEPQPATHCTRCGALLRAGARFCGHCGAPSS
jgi:hypothetical protein